MGEKTIESNNHSIVIAALMEKGRESFIYEALHPYREVIFKRYSVRQKRRFFRQCQSSRFNQFLADEGVDVVLLPADRKEGQQPSLGTFLPKLYRTGFGGTSAAMMGVVASLSDSDWSSVSVLGFDGWLATTFPSEQMFYEINMALRRRDQRLKGNHRYQKVRQLNQALNRKRHILRDQVDLLCRDLVDGNKLLTSTCNELRDLCDLQYDLIGEYDIPVLLHRSLQKIRETVADSSIAVCLIGNSEIEAHILDCPFEDTQHQSRFEGWICDSFMPEIVSREGAVILSGAGPSDSNLSQNPDNLRCIMGLPIRNHDSIVGVLVAYREGTRPYKSSDVRKASVYVDSLGKAIGSRQALSRLLEKSL